MADPYKINIEREVINNNYYRKELYTDKYQQLVIMNLLPYEEIGNERHKGTQFFKVEYGYGRAYIKDKTFRLKEGSILIVPPHTYHNIVSGPVGLKLFTIYSPPQHERGTKQKLK